MSYQKQAWRDYDDTKTELQNMQNGAVVTPERMNHIETGIANSANKEEVAAQLAQTDVKKADVSYVDNKVQQVADGTPKITASTLSELLSNYPEGSQDNAIVTANGHIYHWDGASWTDTGILYQAIGIADKTVTNGKIVSVDDRKVESDLKITHGTNLFDKDDLIPGYYVNHNNGEFGSNSDANVSKRPVSPNTTYTIANMAYAAFYDENDDFIPGTGINVITRQPHTFTTPSKASIIRFSTFNSNLKTQQLVLGSSLPAVAEPFEVKINAKAEPKDDSVTYRKMDKYANQLLSKSNLFPDPLFESNLSDLISPSSGATKSGDEIDGFPTLEVKNGSISFLKRAKVNASEEYEIKIKVNSNQYDFRLFYFYYTTGGAYLSGEGRDYTSGGDIVFPITAPSDAVEIRVGINNRLSENLYISQLFVGKPGENFSELLELKKATKELGKQVGEAGHNPLYNKKVNFNGDSLTANQSWATMIAERNSMDSSNYAVAGGTIVYKQGRHCISQSVRDMRTDGDYIILSGGYNDSHLGTDMGEITPDYTSEFDEDTFCGAFESMIKYSYQTYPGKKIGFVITHKRPGTFSPYGGQDDDYYNFNNFRLKMVEMLEKWSVPYFDLYINSGLPQNVPEIQNIYFEDNTHPNSLGHAVWADKIEAWMRTL